MELHNCSITQNVEKKNLKDTFVKWNAAVQLHSMGKYKEALDSYQEIHNHSARVLYNMAMSYLQLDDTTSAKKYLSAAIDIDVHMAIAYYQRAILNMEDKRYDSAIEDSKSARLLMRSNTFIDYTPLGLSCRLHIFQIMFNLSLAYLHIGDENEAVHVLTEATHYVCYKQRNQILSSLQLIEQGRVEDIQPIPIPTDLVFVLPNSVTCNLDRMIKLEKSSLVFCTSSEDNSCSWDAMKTVEKICLRSGSNTTRCIPLLKLSRHIRTLSWLPNVLRPFNVQ